MTFVELLVIGGGLILGYWIVGRLLNNKKLASPASTQSNDNSQNDARSDRSQREAPRNKNSREDECIPESWFRILDVSEGASQDQIVTAYKLKIRQYHPDKVAQMGAEIREIAEFKSKQINAAYDYAMKLRR